MSSAVVLLQYYSNIGNLVALHVSGSDIVLWLQYVFVFVMALPRKAYFLAIK